MKLSPAHFLVAFYKVWHGFLHLPGAGLLITKTRSRFRSLWNYPLLLGEGQTIFLDFRDASAFAWLNDTLGDPHQESAMLTALLRFPDIREKVMWDVGANCGLLSYKFSKEIKPKELVAIEPNPAVFNIARQAIGPLPNVRVMNIGLSDRDGALPFREVTGDSFCGSFETNDDVQPGAGKILEIPVVSGDNLVRTGSAPMPDIIKIDTEGHEKLVLAGLAEVIANHRPVIIMEHIEFSEEEFLRLVPGGYKLCSIRDADGVVQPGLHRSGSHNVILLPEDRLAGLEFRGLISST